MKTLIISVNLKNETRMDGPTNAVMAWLGQQLGYRPEEILPAVITVSTIEDRETADQLGRQWVETQ